MPLLKGGISDANRFQLVAFIKRITAAIE